MVTRGTTNAMKMTPGCHACQDSAMAATTAALDRAGTRTAPTPGWAARMARTKRALADAAVDLFIRQGYEETSIEEIAAAAGVSRRTFFRYFPTKEAVILEPMVDDINQFVERLEARPRDESILDSLLVVSGEQKAGNPYLPTAMRLYRAVRSTPQLGGTVSTFLDHFRNSIAAWAAPRLGRSPDDLHVQLIAAGATAAREAALRLWAEGDDPTALPAISDEAYRALAGSAVERAYAAAGVLESR